MHLIYILVIAVSCLTILSALALVFGSAKSEKKHSLWFLVAAIGEVMWGVGIAVALSLPANDFGNAVMPVALKCLYVGALVMDSTILGYVAWKYKIGKVVTSVFLIVASVLSVIFLYDSSVLYTSYTLAKTGNTIDYLMPNEGGWFFGTYIAFFCTVVPAFCFALIYKIRNARSKDDKKGYTFFLIGLAIAGFFSLIFDLIMAPERYDLIWVGPLLIGLTMLGFYYAVLRYRMIVLSAGWLKIMSSVVIVSGAVIIYLLVFHIIFSALFRVSSPSFQVILLNFIMIAIVLLLTPAITEIFAMTKSLIMTKQIDIAYIVKKLSRLNQRRINLKEISGFLAEHMHFTYVGFMVNGKYYVMDEHKIAIDKLICLPDLVRPDKGIWQDVEKLDSSVVRENGISRIAVMTNANGDMIGQVVFGKPTTKSTLDRKDLVDVEMVVNMMGTMIENGSRKS